MMRYRVAFFQDDIYEVIDEDGITQYQGTLTNCEAWIRLKEENRF